MIKNRKAINIFIMGMVVLFGLTGCQKPENKEAEYSEQTVNEAENGAEASETEQETMPQETVQQKDDASLESFSDSPEFQACTQWWEFMDGYDTDGAILMEAVNEDKPVEEGYEYEPYACYTQEMENKVEEICGKYGLSKLSGCQVVESYSELCSKAGVGEFCRDNENAKHETLSGYLYDDGTFLFEGNIKFSGSTVNEAGYQFTRAVKGTFNVAYLNLGDLAEYSTRTYTTQSGDNVIFLCHEEINPTIIAEREKSFVIVSGLGDLLNISDVNDESLELFADAFDFAAIP